MLSERSILIQSDLKSSMKHKLFLPPPKSTNDRQFLQRLWAQGSHLMSSVPITSSLLGAFKPSKRFSSKHGTRITSVDFDDTGEWCVTAGEDETIQVYDCKRGKYAPCFLKGALLMCRHSKTLYSKKYGVHLARFTHHSQNVIYASTKEDGTEIEKGLSFH